MQKIETLENLPAAPAADIETPPPSKVTQAQSGRAPGKVRYEGVVRSCANDDCGRPLHLGRHKSVGEICARCRKSKLAREIEQRAWEREFGTPEQIRQQLADHGEIPGDPLSEEWARRCRRQKIIDAFRSCAPGGVSPAYACEMSPKPSVSGNLQSGW